MKQHESGISALLFSRITNQNVWYIPENTKRFLQKKTVWYGRIIVLWHWRSNSQYWNTYLDSNLPLRSKFLLLNGTTAFSVRYHPNIQFYQKQYPKHLFLPTRTWTEPRALAWYRQMLLDLLIWGRAIYGHNTGSPHKYPHLPFPTFSYCVSVVGRWWHGTTRLLFTILHRVVKSSEQIYFSTYSRKICFSQKKNLQNIKFFVFLEKKN